MTTKKISLALVGIVVLTALACLFWPRSVTWHTSGQPGVITVRVVGPFGQPVTGVSVYSESYSGTTSQQLTDSNGEVKILPGESEVIGLYVNQRHVFNRDWYMLGDFLAPSCNNGLTFTVRLRK